MVRYISGITITEFETVVKQFSKTHKDAHVSLPLSMLNKRISLTLIDDNITFEDWARIWGHSAHVCVNGEWIGKRIRVKVLDK
jgi:putative transposon-encoded protein